MSHLFGISLFVLAMFFFSSTYALYKACDPFLSETLILFFQNLCSWILILPFALKNGIKWLDSNNLGKIVLRSFLGIASIYCIGRALLTVNLAEVVLLNNSAPLFIPFIIWFWHKSKISLGLWISLIIGFIGIFIILRPGFEEVGPGYFIALFSGMAAAGMLVVLRLLAGEPFLRILFYYFLIFWVILAPFLFTAWISPPLWIWALLGLAGVTMILAQVTMTIALRHAPSHELAPFIYTSVLFAGILDWIFWKIKPDWISVVGMVVVGIGCIITIFLGTKKKA